MSNIITTLFGKNEAYFSSLRCGLIKAMYRVGVLIEVAFHLYAMIRECRKAVFILGWIPPFDIFDHTALLIYCLACVTLHGTWAGLVMGAHLNIVPPSATVLANDADRHYHALLCVAHFIGAGFYLSKAVWNHWRGKPWTLQPVIVPLFLGLLHRSLLCIWQLNDDNERRHSFARRSIQRHSVRTSCSEAVAPAASEYRLR
ncbi:uncharacterized protein LOC111269503 isoform X2 [Varroa jacobsoni]|uniref:Uncharacterized protein n=1 Tax=Varroa destructor TaxID=109461 RepID=A0A7M7JZ24_VARDE|nr:uncharacterized protein LOC111249474 isoform X2 [Varroa destructor]XP_022704886.1 uncharacterized protein LOC111269503 isoform X2 [Varroa jacobsoni]